MSESTEKPKTNPNAKTDAESAAGKASKAKTTGSTPSAAVAAAAIDTAVEAAKKRDVQLEGGRIQQAEYERNDFVVTVDVHTTLDDILKPGFFAHCANDLKPYDRIEVRTDDGRFLLELLVMQTGRAFAITKLLAHYPLSEVEHESVGMEHEVRYRGPYYKWCVIRKANNQVVAETIVDQSAAIRWMLDFEKRAKV